MVHRMQVLLLEGLSDPIGLTVARCLSDMPGVSVHTYAADEQSHLRHSRHSASFHVQPGGLDDSQAIEHLRRVVDKIRPDVIMPIMEPAVAFASANRAALSAMAALAPTPAPAAYQVVSNKGHLALFLQKRALPVPETVIYTPDAAFYERVARLQFPVMLKPATARGGRGIMRFETSIGLRAYCQANGPFDEPYIVQRYIKGYDIDCSVLCLDGRVLAYTQQQAVIAPVSTYGPSQGIAIVHHEPLLEVTERFIAALGWSGIAHIDLRYSSDDNEIKVIELNPRFWNTMLGSQLAGVNFPYLAALAALGQPFERPAYVAQRYAPLGAALREFLRGLRGKEHVAFGLGDTNARYLLTDPMPTVMRVLASLARRLPARRAGPARVAASR